MRLYTGCPDCGSEDITTSLIDVPAFSGMPNVRLVNVPSWICRACGSEGYTVPRQGRVLAQVREFLCAVPRELDGREFAFLRQGLRLTGMELSHMLGVSNVSISRWENGDVPVQPAADRLLRVLTFQDLGKGKYATQLLMDLGKGGTKEVVVDVSCFSADASVHEHATLTWGQGGAAPWVIHNHQDRDVRVN